MSYKDKLKQSQRGNFTDAPSLPIAYNIDVRENPNKPGVIAFSFWDKGDSEEDKKQVFTSKPINGIFLGGAMKITCFSDNIGKNGGKYYTSIYFKNTDKVTLYKPANGKSEKVMTGTVDEIKKYLSGEISKAKAVRCIYVLSQTGILKFETNTTISIDQLKKIEKQLADNMITLTPKEYDPADTSISKTAKEYLSKFANKNKPKYASISLGAEITEEIAAEWKLDEAVDAYIEWKTFKEKTGAATDSEHPDANVERASNSEGNQNGLGNGHREPAFNTPAANTKTQKSNLGPEEEDSDLPF